jgi:hypothetical protein
LENSLIRIYVIYGQGGKGPLSAGFILFKNRLQEMGYDVVDSYSWKYPQAIIDDIEAQPEGTKIVLLG